MTNDKVLLSLTDRTRRPATHRHLSFRRRKGDGSIVHRPDGRFEVRVTLPNGRRKSLYAKTEQDAHTLLLMALRRIREGTTQLLTKPPKTRTAAMTPDEQQLFAELHTTILSMAQPVQHPLCGVYFLIEEGTIVYVGQSINIQARVLDHVRSHKNFDSYSYLQCPRAQLDSMETRFIQLFRPRDNKAPLRREVARGGHA